MLWVEGVRHKHAYPSGYPELSGIPSSIAYSTKGNSMLQALLRMPLVEDALVFTAICFV